MPILLREIFVFLFGAIVGGFITYHYDRRLIKDQSTSDYCSDAFDFFNEILNDIKMSDNKPVIIILNSLIDTEAHISAVTLKIGKQKSVKLSRAYEQYKAPNKEGKTDEFRLFPYNFNDDVFAKHPEYHVGGVKNGKELAIYNIQQILNLLK